MRTWCAVLILKSAPSALNLRFRLLQLCEVRQPTMRHAMRPTEPAWLQAVIENPYGTRAPLTPFAAVERQLATARRTLKRSDVSGEERRLLIEEAQILEQDLAARPFNLRTARLCEQKLAWLAQRAKQLKMSAPSNDLATTNCA